MVRLKVRYLLGEVRGEGLVAGEGGLRAAGAGGAAEVLRAPVLAKAMRDAVQANFGDHGAGAIQQLFSVKYVNSRTGLFIVRVARDQFRILWGALTFITALAGVPCMLTVIHVGGTIRSCQRAAVAHSRVQLKLLHGAAVAGASVDLQQELADLEALIQQEAEEIDDQL